MLEEQQSSSNSATTLPTTSTPQTGSRLNQISSQSYKIITQYGDMLVIKQGIQLQSQQMSGGGGQSSDLQQSSQQRPIIMTFHDLGLNSELQFATFCECEEVKLMLKTFTMIHVNFIGQEFPSQQQQQLSQQQIQTTPFPVTSNTLPDEFKYPNMEQMAESIVDVCAQLRIRSFIAIAVGAGAHIVGNLALMRPDLVDGLFLINPVITSCSITEWLYFKMSAIASNHSIGNWNSAIGGSKDWSTSLLSSSTSSSNSNHSITLSNHQNVNKNLASPTSSAHGATQQDNNSHHKHHSHGIGFKKLLNAAHLHFPHHHHHHNKRQNENKNNNSDNETGLTDLKQSPLENQQQQESLSGSETVVDGDKSVDESKSIAAKLSSNLSISETSSINNSPIDKAPNHSGSRLRQLIFSRNIRSTVHQSDQLSRTSSTSAGSAPAIGDTGYSKHKHGSSCRVKASDSDDSIDSQRSSSGKRPPSEYLMYHHFGPISFQTYRRSSDTPLLTMFHNRDSPSKIKQRPQSGGQEAGGDSSANSDGSRNNSKQNSGQCSPATPATPATPRGSRQKRALIGQQVSSASPIGHSNIAQESRSSGRCRSDSVCMDSTYLASFDNERQRSLYIQSVYKHYFSQINSHNLWLFAQSFAKRRSLNLRKDCGAAAHAAAAAATLGTSICSAFVGMTPGPSLSDSTSSAHHITSSRSMLNKPVGNISSSSTTKQPSQHHQHQETKANDTKLDTWSQKLDSLSHSPPHASSSSSSSKQDRMQATTTNTIDSSNNITTGIGQRHVASNTSAKSKQNCQQPKALVAGTKVKRTFTCQTLIMCSSVQMHRERAFKLMSLLNPLQATWIQTDHLLVLEEKPEKVCQALRLFLQGIGYSMSTYERRLRLSSTTGSAGSADSNNSGPSLNEAQQQH